MMKSALLLAAAAGMLAVSSTASLASPSDANQWELTLSGQGYNDVDFDGTTFGGNATVGYYFTPQWQVNLRQSVNYTDLTSGDEGSSWDGATRVGVDYHFDFGQDQRFIPFVGAEIGYLYGQSTDDTFAAGPEAGVKWYVNDTTFIYGSVLYEFLFDSGDEADDSFDDGRFVYSLGIGFRF